MDYVKEPRLVHVGSTLRLSVLVWLISTGLAASIPAQANSTSDADQRGCTPTSGNVTLEELIDRIVNITENASQNVQALKALYINNRFKDKEFESVLSDAHMDGLPASMADTDEENNSKKADSEDVHSKVTRLANIAYEDLSSYLPFVMQASKDEGNQQESESYEDHYHAIETEDLAPLLCLIDEVRHKLQAKPQLGDNRDYYSMMSKDLRNIPNNALRHIRDYLMLRNLATYLQDFGERLSRYNSQDIL